jgi:hypothetical protein
MEALKKQLSEHLENVGRACSTDLQSDAINHGAAALSTFDTICPLIEDGDSDIRYLLSDTRIELLDAYTMSCAGRHKTALILLRGVMEGLFTALYYRQQSISLNLWSSNTAFVFVHQFFEDRHEFFKYFSRLFSDERFKRDHPNTSGKKVFEEASLLYELLSGQVHKKAESARKTLHGFEGLVERIFRIFLTFLEREDDLPRLAFPSPLTFPGTVVEQKKRGA